MASVNQKIARELFSVVWSIRLKKKKIKLSPEQVVEAHRVVRF
jgi:hypothetical protein